MEILQFFAKNQVKSHLNSFIIANDKFRDYNDILSVNLKFYKNNKYY